MPNAIKITRFNLTDRADKASLKSFVEIAYRLNAGDPNWVPPMRIDVYELLNPKKNPFFGHATVQPMLARRDGKIVGRISAHLDHLALKQPVAQGMGPGTGNWGMLEAENETVAAALIAAAEDWLREQGMTRALGPLSLSIWDEPGLQIKGQDTPPVFMMGHDNVQHQAWVEAQGYTSVKRLLSYGVPILDGFSPFINRIVEAGERNARIKVRGLDMKNYLADAAIILSLLNDAWSENWGFVPLSDAEIAYVGKKLKPIARSDLVMIAEYDGEPVAFMITLPDMNEVIKPLGGRVFPFGFVKLLWWLRTTRAKTMRVPLMGVKRTLQNSRMASQLVMMMIEYIRRVAVAKYDGIQGEIGWVLEDNQGMNAIADILGGSVIREYLVYEKDL